MPEMMRAMVLQEPKRVLREVRLPIPEAGPGKVLIRVRACGVCRTDLHIVDGELPDPKLPLIPGHEIVGEVVRVGKGAEEFKTGERIGVPWLGYTDAQCIFCQRGKENLCDNALFTGYTIDGGYAEYTVADHRYCFRIPEAYGDAEAAPLLCAGLIGYRSYRLAGEDVKRLGIYGFGAAAHIVAQIAAYHGRVVYAFVRPGDAAAKEFALKLGACWAGDSDTPPPHKLDAAIIFAPVGRLVVKALKETVKGGIVVCGGIHMSDIPSFPYGLLWGERIVRSVANLTRRDGKELLRMAPEVPVKTEVRCVPLERANEALDLLRRGEVRGAAVLTI